MYVYITSAALVITWILYQHSVPMYLSCLTGNRLGDQGLEDLLSVLRSLTGLTSLDLSCNGVTKAGLKALADCVSSIREEAGTGAPKVNHV